jgi:hypothetical protein
MSSDMDLLMQELEIKDLRSEIVHLREIIKFTNNESGKMKMTLRTQQMKVSTLQRLTKSHKRCDTSSYQSGLHCSYQDRDI